jgi:hypothetical protein
MIPVTPRQDHMTRVSDVGFKAAGRLHVPYVQLNELHTFYQIMLQLGPALSYTVCVLVCPSDHPSVPLSHTPNVCIIRKGLECLNIPILMNDI